MAIGAITIDLLHLIPLARKIIAEHNLEVPLVVDRKAVLKALKSPPELRTMTIRGDKEIWSPDVVPEVIEFRKKYKARLAEDYPRDRAYWPAALSVLMRECGAKLDPTHPWLEWHQAILGQPYPELPPVINWRAFLYHIWLDRQHEWRYEWESRFFGQYPDADELEIMSLGQGGGNEWNDWRLYAYIHGFGYCEGIWENRALAKLARAQDMELEFGEVK